MRFQTLTSSAVDLAIVSPQSPMSMLVMSLRWLVIVLPAIDVSWFLRRRFATRAGAGTAVGGAATAMVGGGVSQPYRFHPQSMNVVVPATPIGHSVAVASTNAARTPTVVELVGQIQGPNGHCDVFSVSDGLIPSAPPNAEQVRAYLPTARRYVA